MKKLLILLAVLLSVVTTSYSQDTVRIKHTNYTTDKPTGVHSHQVTVKDIEKLTGFKFN